jgi:hypothetical protein
MATRQSARKKKLAGEKKRQMSARQGTHRQNGAGSHCIDGGSHEYQHTATKGQPLTRKRRNGAKKKKKKKKKKKSDLHPCERSDVCTIKR